MYLTAAASFLGHAPRWYSHTVLVLLVLNVVLWLAAGPVITAWAIVLEFIFTLAMALKCYPLAPGGLIATAGRAARPRHPRAGVRGDVERLSRDPAAHLHGDGHLLHARAAALSLLARAHRSAFADAAGVCFSAWLRRCSRRFSMRSPCSPSSSRWASASTGVYFRVACGSQDLDAEHLAHDAHVPPQRQAELEQFRAALRGLSMHAAVGTALGGVTTLVGEPQNLLIGHEMGWSFREYFLHSAPVSLPVFAAGAITCALVDRLRLFGFGTPIPAAVRELLIDFERQERAKSTERDRWRLCGARCGGGAARRRARAARSRGRTHRAPHPRAARGFHRVSEEHTLAEGFKGVMPFTALLVVFFAIVAVIHAQDLFGPVIAWVLERDGAAQTAWLYLANGVLSAVSDNVFVATIYITEVKRAFEAGLITREQLELMAVAINTGTNIPSVATPNGQAAFLFLLTSALAPLIGLSYGRMVWMALPYTIVLTVVGLLSVIFLLH